MCRVDGVRHLGRFQCHALGIVGDATKTGMRPMVRAMSAIPNSRLEVMRDLFDPTTSANQETSTGSWRGSSARSAGALTSLQVAQAQAEVFVLEETAHGFSTLFTARSIAAADALANRLWTRRM
jgi:hypothetical protein